MGTPEPALHGRDLPRPPNGAVPRWAVWALGPEDHKQATSLQCVRTVVSGSPLSSHGAGSSWGHLRLGSPRPAGRPAGRPR